MKIRLEGTQFDGQTADITKLIVTSRNFVKASKNTTVPYDKWP
jgi:hypothetical protein